MISHFFALFIGFVTGALVFRNNAAKAEKVVLNGKAVAEKVKEAAKR